MMRWVAFEQLTIYNTTRFPWLCETCHKTHCPTATCTVRILPHCHVTNNYITESEIDCLTSLATLHEHAPRLALSKQWKVTLFLRMHKICDRVRLLILFPPLYVSLSLFLSFLPLLSLPLSSSTWNLLLSFFLTLSRPFLSGSYWVLSTMFVLLPFVVSLRAFFTRRNGAFPL